MVVVLGAVNGTAQVFKTGQRNIDPLAAILIQVGFRPTKKTRDGLGVLFGVCKLMDGGHHVDRLNIAQFVCNPHGVGQTGSHIIPVLSERVRQLQLVERINGEGSVLYIYQANLSGLFGMENARNAPKREHQQEEK